MILIILAICGGKSQLFNVNGSFVVPAGVSYVRAIAVGGGGGGYINYSTVAVTSGQSIVVIVGIGGTGAQMCVADNIIVGNTAGGASSFGSYVVADGGSSCGEDIIKIEYGCAGGTGSGANCYGICPAGTVGGTGGPDGNDGMGTPSNGGQGMGNMSYNACLNMAKLQNLTAGAGGLGGQPVNDNVINDKVIM